MPAPNPAVTKQLAALSHRVRMLERAVLILLDTRERTLERKLAAVRAKLVALQKSKA